MFHADGWTDIPDEANSQFSDNFANAPKSSKFCPHTIYIVRRPISEQRANCAPINVQLLVFIADMASVDCAVRNKVFKYNRPHVVPKGSINNGFLLQ
jgi:hypothetical protein